MTGEEHMFDALQYITEHGWDFTCIEATAALGVSAADLTAIDAWAGVHADDYDPPTEEEAMAGADAVEAANRAARELRLYCQARVQDASGG